VIACGVAAVLLGAPSESKALFDWLCPWAHNRQATATTYAPPFRGQPVALVPRYNVAPAVAVVPTAVPATACYVPQTCYRTVYRPVATTVLSPVTSYDPCTGCPVTAYRPVTTLAQRAFSVPYTTYRLVYTNPYAACAPTVSCNPCGGLVGSAITGGAGCSPCAPGGPSPTLSPIPMAPSSGSLPYYPAVPSGGATGGQPAYGTLPGPSSGTASPPSGSGAPGSSQPSTFKTLGPSSGGQGDLRAKPDASTGPSAPKPSPSSPAEGRTASLTVRNASYDREVPPASVAASPAPFRPGIDDWEPGHRPTR